MTTRFLPFCGILFAASSLLVGQPGKLAGPVAGYVFDSGARVLRPIQGVPGAALLGDPLAFGFDVAVAYVSPHQDAAFVVGADDSLHLFRIDGAVTEIGLGGVSGVPQSVVFSPSGTAAALYGLGKARILTGLPEHPALAGTISVPALLRSAAEPVANGRRRPVATETQLALSDDGNFMLAVAGGSARLLSMQGQNRDLLPAHAGARVAFAPGGHDAAVADPADGVSLIRDAAGTGLPQLLAAPDASLAQPAGIAFSQDRLTLYVANASGHAVAAFNLGAGSRTSIDCKCTPAALVPMGPSFRLNDAGPSPLWLLDAGASTPRTVFVPVRGE